MIIKLFSLIIMAHRVKKFFFDTMSALQKLQRALCKWIRRLCAAVYMWPISTDQPSGPLARPH